MSVTVRYLGPLAEIAGTSSEMFEAVRSDGLLEEVRARHPALFGRAFSLAVDGTIISGPVDLREDAAVSLLPPFSGG